MNEDIKNALKVLINGGTLLYPTDTVWGIGCDATNEEAVKKVFKIKKRADTKSMLVLIDDFSRIKDYVTQIPKVVLKILESENKPLTIIYPGAKNLASNLINIDGSIGIRIVKDEFCNRLISEFKKPIVSTSANISGKPAPTKFSEINPEIKKNIHYVVKWRQDDSSQYWASGIIKVAVNGKVEVIRK